MVNVNVLYDKPYGSDQVYFGQMNRKLEEHTNPNYLDHYLLKPSIAKLQELLKSDFFKPLLELPIDYITSSLVENLGMEDRAGFYEKTNVVRDMIQNHGLQVAAKIVHNLTPDLLNKNVHEANQIILANTELKEFVLGQYLPGEIDGKPVKGYRQEDGVNPNSNTPTYFAGLFLICGKDVYIRSGKGLKKKVAKITIHFESGAILIFRLAPNPCAIIRLNQEIKFKCEFNLEPEAPYAQIMRDLMLGDTSRIVTPAEIDLSWKIVDPALNSTDLCYYEAGSWGPVEAALMLQKEGRSWWIPGRE
jgi:glucose-6-phosphate 1-dehydrogenase